MAAFNKKYLMTLVEQVKTGEKIPSALEAMDKLEIPLEIAVELELENVLSSLTVFKKSIDSILAKLAQKKEAEEKMKERRAKKAEQARTRYAAKKQASSSSSDAPKKKPKHTAMYTKCMKMRKNINVC